MAFSIYYRTRPKAPDARQTKTEESGAYIKYVSISRSRITPQTGFSAAFLAEGSSFKSYES